MSAQYFFRSVPTLTASSVLIAAAASAAPPPNDNCINATVVDGNSMYPGTVNLAEATTQPCEASPGCSNATHSVWYQFTAPGDGWLGLSATNFYFDSIAPVVAVYDGCAVNLFGDCLQPQVLGCQAATWNNEWLLWSLWFDVELQAGETYLIELASSDGYGGEVFSFDMFWTAQVLNDDCSNAKIISAGEYADVVDVFDATNQPCENEFTDCDAGTGTARSVWYRFDATWPGTLNLDTQGSSYAMVLSAYDGCPIDDQFLGCVTPAELGCDSGAAQAGAQLALPVAPGGSYLIRAALGFDYFPEYTLQFDSQFIPANDTCDIAAPITSNSYNPPAFPIGGATASLIEPLEPCDSSIFGVTNSVFFSFTPDADGHASINTLGSTFDSVLSVFDGCGMLVLPNGYNQPNLVACNDDVGGLLGTASVLTNVAMETGQTYIIKVASNDPTGSETGMLDFNFQFEPNTCVADIAPAGGDNSVNVDDLLAVINAWGACGNPFICPADIAPGTGDGAVNVDDLLAVISAWGACP